MPRTFSGVAAAVVAAGMMTFAADPAAGRSSVGVFIGAGPSVFYAPPPLPLPLPPPVFYAPPPYRYYPPPPVYYAPPPPVALPPVPRFYYAPPPAYRYWPYY